jgi:hypothetical protein
MEAPPGEPAYIGTTSLPVESWTPCPFPGVLPANVPATAPVRWHWDVTFLVLHVFPRSVLEANQVWQSPDCEHASRPGPLKTTKSSPVVLSKTGVGSQTALPFSGGWAAVTLGQNCSASTSVRSFPYQLEEMSLKQQTSGLQHTTSKCTQLTHVCPPSTDLRITRSCWPPLG